MIVDITHLLFTPLTSKFYVFEICVESLQSPVMNGMAVEQGVKRALLQYPLKS